MPTPIPDDQQAPAQAPEGTAPGSMPLSQVPSKMLGPVAEQMVPHTGAGWLSMGGQIVGMLTGQKLAYSATVRAMPYLAKLPPAVWRVVAGAITAEMGSEIGGGEFGEGAKSAAIGGTLGEVAGAGVGGVKAGAKALARRTPIIGTAMKEREVAAATAAATAAKEQAALRTRAGEARQQAATQMEQQRTQAQQAGEAAQQRGQAAFERGRLTRERGELATGLAGQVAQTTRGALQPEGAAGLAEIGREPLTARRDLGKFYEMKLQETEALIGGADTTIRVPSLAQRPGSLGTIKRPGGQPMHPDPKLNEILMRASTKQTERMTLREASDRLKDLGYGIWRNRDGTEVRLPKHEAAKRYAAGRAEIQGELESFSADAVDAWDTGRYAFSAGNAIVRALSREKLWDRTPAEAQIDRRGLQQVLTKHWNTLKDRMAPDELQALRKLVWQDQPIESLAATKRQQLTAIKEPARREKLTAVPQRATTAPPARPTSSPFSPAEMTQLAVDAALERIVYSARNE